jgi:ribosome-interacting GTPase 1
MPINAHPEYLAAENEYLQAQTLEEKIEKLKKMISNAPGHKGAENLRAQLKTRLKKFQGQVEKLKKSGKKLSAGIKKQDMQAVIIGKKGSGKSWLLSRLTNANPKIKENLFHELTTKKPEIGILNYGDTQIQLIENPAIDSEYYDKGLTNTADTILILINKLEDLSCVEKFLDKTTGKKIIIFNNRNNQNKRKVSATLQSKKYNFEFIENIEELKEKIFKSFNKIRVYTKEPGKEKSQKPIIMKPDSNISDVAEKILKGFSKNIVETKIWGPSSKFSGQKVGLKHKLKDLDVVEFKTK